MSRKEPFVVTCHPDHFRSLMKAGPGESPLRPILGPNSILTSVGERHMRQRKLLLPPFHGEAVQRYVQMISEVAEREIDSWPIGEPFALAPRMQAVEDGQPLTDQELRDELLSLVLAGHETTANSLTWIFERLLRTPAAYGRLRDLVRAGGEDGDAYVEATIHEGMRNRPVIPMIVRMVKRPWRFGDYVLPARTPVAVSIVALHHREDVYPDPFAFRPERFVDTKQLDDPGDERSGEAGRRAFIKPGTYIWIPFGGGIRRCLGASLAMAEQRVVLSAVARRTDLRAPDPEPERARQRNVTTIPSRGARVLVDRRYAA